MRGHDGFAQSGPKAPADARVLCRRDVDGCSGDSVSRKVATLNQMVKRRPNSDALDAVFSALADPTRRGIVVRLAEGEASVSELARPFDVSLPAVTKHLAVLERAGLLEHHKQGRVRRCRLVAAPLRVADDWLSTYRVFWERRLDSLAQHLKATKEDR